MNCETCREHLVDYLYGELDEHRREAVEVALRACPDCRDELASLQAIRDGWQRTAAVEAPARMHANILREARLAADARSGAGDDAPWWAAMFQPAFAMAAVAVLGVGASIAVVSGGDQDDDGAASMEAVANAPVVEEEEDGAEVEPTLAVLDEGESGDFDEPRDTPSPRAADPRVIEAEAEPAAAAAATATAQQAAVDRLDTPPGAAQAPSTTRSATGYDGAALAEGPVGAAAGGGGGVPIREPWQSRTLGGSVLDNEGRSMSNAMRPDLSAGLGADPNAGAEAEADLAEYAPSRDRGTAQRGAELYGTTGAATSGAASSGFSAGARGTGSGSTWGPAGGDASLDDAVAANAPARSADARSAAPPSPAPTPAPAADADPQPTELAMAADLDDEAEEGLDGDGFAGEIAREARAEMGVAPDDLYVRGTSAFDRGDWFVAVNDLSSFVGASAPSDPRRAEALYNVGASQVQLGQRDAARATLERFVSLYPDHPWAAPAQRLLDDLGVADADTMMRRQNAAPAAEPVGEPASTVE